MDGLLIIILVATVLWIFGAPIFGLIALSKASRLRRDIDAAYAEILRLRTQLGGASLSPDIKPEPQPEPAPAPAVQRPPVTSVPVQPAPRPVEPAAQAVSVSTAARATPPRQVGAAKGRDWERMIAANWMIWAGGLALAIGGLFLVRVAIDAGYFGPLQRTIAAAVFGGGLIASAFQARRWDMVRSAENAVRFLPQVLAGAGVISLFGAAIACGLMYQFVPPLTALALVVAVSALAVSLSLRFGPVLAVLGLVGAYVAPLLTGAEGGSVLTLLPYFAVVTGGGLALVRLSGWRWLSWVLLGGAGFWGLMAVGSNDVLTPIAAPAYALALAVMGLVFGAREAEGDLALPKNGVNPRYIAAGFGSSQLAAYLFWLLAGGLIFLTGWSRVAGPSEAAALSVFAGLGLLSAWQRPGYGLMAPIAGAVTLGSLSLWAVSAPPLVYACLAAAIGFGLGGALVLQGQRLKSPVAIAGALVPAPALFIAFWRDGGLEPHFGWGLAALVIAVCLTFVLERLRRSDPGFKAHPGAAAAYGLGAILSLALAPFLVLGGFWLGAAMAVVALAIAAVLQRFELPLVRLGAMVAAGAATALLIRPGLVDPAALSTTPILNTMTAGFAVAIGCLFAGSRLAAKDDAVRRAFEGAAMILGFSLIALTIRHIAGEGRLNGAFNGIGEASAYAVAYLGMAASFAWRFSDKGWLFRTAEYVAAFIGLSGVLLAWGYVGRGDVGALPIVNLLAVGFALPAALMAGYGAGLRRAGRTVEGVAASSAAMLTGFIWVSLEVARTMGGSAMETVYGDWGWAYSPAWIAYAFALLFWGVLRGRRAPRFASLAILLASIAKVFLVDMSALEGTARAGSFIGLGLALIAVALFYQRFVFGGGQREGSAAA